MPARLSVGDALHLSAQDRVARGREGLRLKYLTTMENEYLALSVSDYLVERGIATFVAFRDHNGVVMDRRGASDEHGVWIILDHQYEDAVYALEDPDYRPDSPLTNAEIERLRRSLDSSGFRPVMKALLFWLGVIAIGAALVKIIVG